MADFAEEVERFLASFSPAEEAVLRHAFQAILEGRPATMADLAATVNGPPAEIDATIERLKDRGVLAQSVGQKIRAAGRSRSDGIVV